MKKSILLLLAFLTAAAVRSQVVIATGTSVPHGSAMLDVQSTSKGVLIPRLSTAQRTAITGAADGLLVYDNDQHNFYFYKTNTWTLLGSGGGGGGNYTAGTGINIVGTVINNTGDTNPNDDITTATAAGGDLEGNFPTLQIKIGAVGAPEIADGSITAAELAQMGATAGQVLRWNGSAWAAGNVPVSTLIQDADGNTKIQTEKNANEDKLRIDLGGTENLVIRKSATGMTIIEPSNSVWNTAFGVEAGLATANMNVPNGGNNNSYFGYQAGKANAGGGSNTFIGGLAGKSQTTGDYNTFVGGFSGENHLSGGNNTFVGTSAGRFDSIGTDNTFIGNVSGHYNKDGFANTFVGLASGFKNTSGNRNTFIGQTCGYENTTGTLNCFIGHVAGFKNTTGFDNVFMGVSAGNLNTTGYQNTFVGRQAGRDNTTGKWNTAFGFNALLNNTTADQNTAFGTSALSANTTGNYNTAIGVNALLNSANGTQNTAVGTGAGEKNTSAVANTFVGFNAGFGTTTGGSNAFFGDVAGHDNTTGDRNSFFGSAAGNKNISGIFNCFFGHATGQENTLGHDNCYYGVAAGRYNTTGSNNVCLGSFAGTNNTAGIGNVFIGFNAGKDEQASNRLYIENTSADKNTALIYGEFDNNVLRFNGKVGIGRSVDPATGRGLEVNDQYCSKGLPGSWAANSDRRLKKNIRYLDANPESALSQILKMRGITYEWNDDKTGMARPAGSQIGFIAQDLQQIFPEKVWAGADGYLQTAYGDYDALFVESIRALYFQLKNQSAEIEKLRSEKNALVEKVENLESKVARLEKIVEQLAAEKK